MATMAIVRASGRVYTAPSGDRFVVYLPYLNQSSYWPIRCFAGNVKTAAPWADTKGGLFYVPITTDGVIELTNKEYFEVEPHLVSCIKIPQRYELVLSPSTTKPNGWVAVSRVVNGAVPTLATGTPGPVPLPPPVAKPPVATFKKGDLVTSTGAIGALAARNDGKTVILPAGVGTVVSMVYTWGKLDPQISYPNDPYVYQIDAHFVKLVASIGGVAAPSVAKKKGNPDGCECGGYAAGYRAGQEGHAQWCPARSVRLGGKTSLPMQ
jgi:hypothetical protein